MGDYPDYQSAVLTKNHPDYYDHGFVKQGSNNVEYAAFTTAEGASFAIVNTRLFHLKHGRSIIIA